VVVGLLRSHERVRVSFESLHGISSAYFNTLLLRLVQILGPQAVSSRIEFSTDSRAQRVAWDRSWSAVVGRTA